MPPREIIINDITYVRSRDAARIVQLAPDYVSRLARSNLIDGHQVEGLWFVDLASLKNSWLTKSARRKHGARSSLNFAAKNSRSHPD